MNNLPPRPIESQDPAYLRLRWRVLGLWALWALLSAVAVAAFDTFGLLIALVLLGALLLQLLLVLYHRAQIENFQHYRQIEASFSLYSTLRIEHPMPPMRLWVISPDFANLIVQLIMDRRPSLVVELGSGVSTVISAYTLTQVNHGRVVAYDHEAQFAQLAAENLRLHGLDHHAQVIHAPLYNIKIEDEIWQWYDLPHFDQLTGIDFLIVDGPPEHIQDLARYPALPVLFDRLNPGATILVDDVSREEDSAVVSRWLEEFDCELVQVVANEKGAVILQKRRSATTPSN